MEAANSALSGKAIMVVEDEYLIAINIETTLMDMGAEVIGPFSHVDTALEALEAGKPAPHAAILDINVRGRPVFPVAERLSERNIPFVFATGYDNWVIPQALSHVRRFEKPTDPALLARALADLFAARRDSGVA